ncbi:shikimate dehydrogenase [Novosphingobium colocasiae]|uniref:shikimate dehydrogenase family protein n=1 Tax=Novosphingobium colocasiae TaxID=1256513 RepID=UPI0035B04D59
MTTPYAEVIGNPIAQSKSPAIHGFWLSALGLAGRYDRALVEAASPADYITARRTDAAWRGCNVTMPHKQSVMPLLDRLDPLAARVGAVNTVIPAEDGTLTGYNTDVPGFWEPLAGRSFASALVVGAGGAARAVLAALADAGVAAITLQNRSLDKAEALLAEFGIAGTVEPIGTAGAAVDLLVNTSAMGMAGQAPFPLDLLGRVGETGVVYDIVTSPLDTALLIAARGRGLATVDGLAMLIGQADHAFRRFFGAVPPRDRDAELRALLTA